VRRHVRYIDGKPAIISDDYFDERIFDERIVRGTELARRCRRSAAPHPQASGPHSNAPPDDCASDELAGRSSSRRLCR